MLIFDRFIRSHLWHRNEKYDFLMNFIYDIHQVYSSHLFTKLAHQNLEHLEIR